MNYLLDTNACIAVLNDRPQTVRRRLGEVKAAGAAIGISSVVLFELWYGVARSTRREANTRMLDAFLAGPVQVVPFDQADAQVAGELRGQLTAAGTPIGAYDVLIAGQAVRLGATLVTANWREFSRVPGLLREDWTMP